MATKNQGCVIAGCAGAAILAVVLGVGALATGMYLYKRNQAQRVERIYEQAPAAPAPLPDETPLPPSAVPQPAPAPAYNPPAAPPPGYSGPLLTQATLTQELQVEQVARTLEGVQQAISIGTFRGFQQYFVANAARSQLTTQLLDKNFAKFLTMKINIDADSFRRRPKFTTQRNLDDTGTMIQLAGDYIARNPHGASQVKWEFKYVYEPGRGWGIYGLQLNTAPLH
jgi:hypothetical protein